MIVENKKNSSRINFNDKRMNMKKKLLNKIDKMFECGLFSFIALDRFSFIFAYQCQTLDVIPISFFPIYRV